jgi:hypothetical protein
LKIEKKVKADPLPDLEPLPESDYSQALVHLSDEEKRKLKRELLKAKAKIMTGTFEGHKVYNPYV